jgi:hypothetical protein
MFSPFNYHPNIWLKITHAQPRKGVWAQQITERQGRRLQKEMSLQKEMMRLIAEGGRGAGVWADRCDVVLMLGAHQSVAGLA